MTIKSSEQINYDEMSDFDITVQVAASLMPECNHAHTVDDNGNGEAEFWCANPIGETVNAGKYNFCNDPCDAWSIIVDNKLSLEPHATEDTYFSATRHCEFNHQDKNPLRAAMICFLKMKGTEK